MKKMLITVCALSLMFVSVFGICKIISEKEAQDAAKRYEENVIKANEQCKKMMEHMSMEFPDYYGGNYINEDGNLVVCVTSDYDKSSNVLQEYTGNEDIIIRDVVYSYNELLQATDRFNELYATFYGIDTAVNNIAPSVVNNLLESMRTCRIVDKENMIEVEICELDKEKEETFRSIFCDEEYICFKNVNYYFVFTSSLPEEINTTAADDGSSTGGSNPAWYPGSRIYTSAGYSFSTGYPVYFIKNGVL